ncbi:hypothetical protein [Bdellovibrio sp. HCB-110]|uniref:hypothetical protein n=1 Tax=Bdellovibrio sp. HCB-110 TaxID=3391182 RepID=UPI0039B41F67
MKTVSLVSALILAFSLNAFAKKTSAIETQVEALGKLGYGYDVFHVGGKTAEEILQNFSQHEYGEVEELVHKEVEEIAWGDEVDMGTTSARSANAMSGFMIADTEDSLEHFDDTDPEVVQMKARIKKVKKEWPVVIRLLDKAGAQFGYTGNGPGYCGISFATLLVIDTATGTVYQIYLSAGGEC